MNWPSGPLRLALSRPIANGFSFVETIVGIVVVSLTMSLLTFLLLAGQAASQNAEDHLSKLSQTRQAYDALRLLANRIRPPYWSNPATVAARQGDDIIVRYLDGRADRQVQIALADNRLQIRYDDQTVLTYPARGLAMDLAKQGQAVVGLDLSLTWLGTTYQLPIPWAGGSL